MGSNFNQSIIKDLDLEPGLSKIHVKFKINTEGEVVGIQSRGPHPSLDAEATRVVGLIPRMTLRKQHRKPVGMLYSLPIVLIMDLKEKKAKRKRDGAKIEPRYK